MDPAEASKDLNKHLLVVANLKHNGGVISFIRTFAALMSGLVAGLLGVTGWGGFLYFVAAQALAAVVLSFKAGHTPKAFCSGWHELVLGHAVNSVTLLTFVLFWTVSNNAVYLF